MWCGDEGRETCVSCLRRGFGVDLARHVVGWERNNPTKKNGLSPTDRYLVRNVMPWNMTVARPNPTRPRRKPSPYPRSPSPKLRTRFPLWPSVPRSETIRERPPLGKMKKLDLRSSAISPSPCPSCKILDDYFRKIEKAETRTYPPVSHLTEGFRPEERHKQEAQERSERRRKEQEEKRARQEKEIIVTKKMEDVPDYLRDLARTWHQKYPGPDKLFRKDFGFGPKTQTDNDDYKRHLSPCSSRSVLLDGSLEVHGK